MPVAIVSGRDLKFIKKQVGLEELFYAGSHGFEIEGPDNYHYEVEEAGEILSEMDDAEKALHKKLDPVKGVEIERKKYAIAIHYRKVKEQDLGQMNNAVDELVKGYDQLRRTEGKKIIELKPDMDWDKGKAVQVLEKKLLGETSSPLVFYLGDDVTDEDAFRALNNGYGIMVGEAEHKTYADYYLNDVEEVKQFLLKISQKNG